MKVPQVLLKYSSSYLIKFILTSTLFFFNTHFCYLQTTCSSLSSFVTNDTYSTTFFGQTISLKIGSQTNMYSNACEDYGSVNLLFDFDLSDPTFDYEVTIGMNGSSEVYNILDVVNFDSYVISSDYKSVTLDISNSATEDLCALVRLKLVDFDSGYNEAYDLNISVKRGSLTEFDNDLQPQNSNIPMEYYNVIDTDTDISDFYLFPPSGCTGFGSKGFYIKDNLNIDLDFCLEYSNNQNIPIQGNDNFVFGIGGSVTVKDGYTFTAENAYLALCPNLTGEWESIIIEDGATLIAENSTIKNAEKAVKVKDGGTVDLIDNTFTDNWTGIEIDKSVQIDQFDANIFESNIIGMEILRGQIIDLFPLDVTKPNQFIENNVGIQVKELCYNCIIKDNLFDENTYAAINGWQANFFAENNTIDDSPFGIKNNSDLGSLFKLNKIDGVDYGINLTRSFFGPDIINNEITAKNHGIYSLFVSGMEISGFNDILATAQVQTLENNGVGINIGRANKILNNFIDVANTKSAINLNGVRQATASGNVINLLTSNSTTGIGVDASYLQTHLDDNSITTTSSSESFGIKTDNSSDILSTCNTLTGVEDALRSDNNSMEVSFKGNTLSNFTRGVHLNHSSIGIQEHYGNIFSTTGTFGIDANNSDMSVEEQNGSIFWVDSDIDLDFFPDNPVPAKMVEDEDDGGTTFYCTQNYTGNNGADIKSNICDLIERISEDFESLEQVRQNLYLIYLRSLVHTYYADSINLPACVDTFLINYPPVLERVYEVRRAIDTLISYQNSTQLVWWDSLQVLSDTYIQAKQDTIPLNEVSIKTDMEDVVDSIGQISILSDNLQDLISNLETKYLLLGTSEMEQNYKLIGRAIKYYFDHDSLNASLQSSLTSLADDCPYEGGEAVLLARALLGEYKDRYDDTDCNGSSQRSRQSTTYELLVYPNPASSTLYIAGTAGDQYYIYDVTGQLWGSGVINEYTQISVNHLPPGMYYLQCHNSTIKFIVLH